MQTTLTRAHKLPSNPRDQIEPEWRIVDEKLLSVGQDSQRFSIQYAIHRGTKFLSFREQRRKRDGSYTFTHRGGCFVFEIWRQMLPALQEFLQSNDSDKPINLT